MYAKERASMPFSIPFQFVKIFTKNAISAKNLKNILNQKKACGKDI